MLKLLTQQNMSEMTRTERELFKIWRRDAEDYAARMEFCAYCGAHLNVSEANAWAAWVCSGVECKAREAEFKQDA